MRPGITVVIPTIPPRAKMLERAIRSVWRQSLKPTALVVITDTEHRGAAWTRQRGLEQVNTEFVAFLDDDDYWYKNHLQVLMTGIFAYGADYVYSWYDLPAGGADPLGHFGQPFDPCNPVQTTITTLVDTEIAQAAGFEEREEEKLIVTPDGNVAGEDWRFTLRCIDLGAEIVHMPYRTWAWNHWINDEGTLGNTSGRGDRW